MINKIIDEFYEIDRKNFGFNVGSDDRTKSTILINGEEINDTEFCNKDEFKQAIIKGVEENSFVIEQCYQVYLEWSSTEEHKERLKKFKSIEAESIQAHCNACDEYAKYWGLSIDIEPIKNDSGWQFLEFWSYGLTEEAKELVKKGDEQMKYISNKEATEEFIQYNWHIYYHFGEDDFLQYMQLQMLKQKEWSTNPNCEEKYRKYKNIDIKKMIQYAHRIIQEKKFYEIANDDEEKEQRGWLIREAETYLGRLDNEQLRDIIFHHPMRDIQDNEYDDERINNENLAKLEYRYNLVDEAINEEENTINEWIESVRTVKNGDYVSNAFYFLNDMEDDDAYYKLANALANIIEYAIYEDEYKSENKQHLFEEYIKQ